jgi:hypothetical protein
MVSDKRHRYTGDMYCGEGEKSRAGGESRGRVSKLLKTGLCENGPSEQRPEG